MQPTSPCATTACGAASSHWFMDPHSSDSTCPCDSTSATSRESAFANRRVDGRKHLAGPGVEQQGLVRPDQELVECKPGGPIPGTKVLIRKMSGASLVFVSMVPPVFEGASRLSRVQNDDGVKGPCEDRGRPGPALSLRPRPRKLYATYRSDASWKWNTGDLETRALRSVPSIWLLGDLPRSARGRHRRRVHAGGLGSRR